MEWKNIYRGFIMGIADLIPGVSGGTLAVILGIYDRFLTSISGFFSKEWRKHIGFLIPLVFGMGSALLLLSKVIKYMLANFAGPTQFFFLGLVIGVLPVMFKQADVKKNFKIQHYILLIAAVALLAILASMRCCSKMVLAIRCRLDTQCNSAPEYSCRDKMRWQDERSRGIRLCLRCRLPRPSWWPGRAGIRMRSGDGRNRRWPGPVPSLAASSRTTAMQLPKAGPFRNSGCQADRPTCRRQIFDRMLDRRSKHRIGQAAVTHDAIGSQTHPAGRSNMGLHQLPKRSR